jgi:predicted amidohydrolase
MDSRQRVIVLQLQSVDNVQANLKQIEKLLSDVPKQDEGALVCLPENSLYMRLKEGERTAGLDLTDPAFETLKQWAREKNLVFHLGSIPLRWMGKLANSSVMVWPDGRVESSYQKIHLFDISLEGQPPYRESDVFHHGSAPQAFEWRGWKWGQTICYDVRFAELFGCYARDHAVDAMLVPSAFLTKTGEAHWHVLLRARAIENQCYIVAAAQAGLHRSENGSRETFGHSLVIDPWGRILAEGRADGPEKIEVVLDKAEVFKVRRQIPMAQHRRLK